MKKHKPTNVILVSSEPGPQPFGSIALLSGLSRHVLLGRSKICIWICALLVKIKCFKFKIEADGRRDKGQLEDIPINTCLDNLERRA